MTLPAILVFAWSGCDGSGGDGGVAEDTNQPADTAAAADSTSPPDTADEASPEDTSPPADTEADTGGGVTGEGCAPSAKVGRFEILNDPLGSWVTGLVTDGVAMADAVLEAKETDGACVLWMGLNPAFCDPQCVSGEECGLDRICHPEPQRKSVGPVTVEGLKEPLELELNYALEYKKFDFVGAPYEVGSEISLSAPGDELEGFSLGGAGVAPMVTTDELWVITPGEPLTVTWEPADGPGEVRFSVNVDQHGLTPVTLRCVVEDTGTYTVSAELTGTLIEYGAGGASEGWLVRRTIDSTEIEEGCIEMEVQTWRKVDTKCVDCPCTTPPFCPE